MKKVKWFFKMIGICLSMGWRGQMSYWGASWYIHAVGTILGYLGEYTVLYTLIHNFTDIGVFSAAEVCFMYAMGLITYALGNIHTRKFWQIDNIVQRGELDPYLIRPVSPLMQLFVWDLRIEYVAHVVLGVGSMVLLGSQLELVWELRHWLVLMSSIVSGILIMSGISLIGTPLVFWWGKSDSVVRFLRWGLSDTWKYPISIFPDGVRHALFVIPYAFVSYLPCLYLFNKSTAAYVAWIPVFTMTAGVVINLMFWGFWRLGLRRYNSAGG